MTLLTSLEAPTVGKLAIALLMIGLLSCADAVPDATTDGQPHFEIVKLRDGVWAAVAIDGRYAVANSGIVNMGGGKSLIFDTSLTPEVGVLLKKAADSLIDGQVFLVVNSNFESDHVRGNQVFSDDATVFGTTRTQQGVNESEPIRLEFDRKRVPEILKDIRERARKAIDESEKKDLALELGYFEALVSSVDDVVPTAPTLVWDHKMNFNGEDRSVKIIPFGHAATESDAVLYLKADSLLFASDLLVVDRHPSMETSNLQGWRAALDSLELLPVYEIIPGHGPVTDKDAIGRTRQYLDMVEQMANEVSAGRITAAESVPAPPFDELLKADRFSVNLLAIIRSKEYPDQLVGEVVGEPRGL